MAGPGSPLDMADCESLNFSLKRECKRYLTGAAWEAWARWANTRFEYPHTRIARAQRFARSQAGGARAGNRDGKRSITGQSSYPFSRCVAYGPRRAVKCR